MTDRELKPNSKFYALGKYYTFIEYVYESEYRPSGDVNKIKFARCLDHESGENVKFEVVGDKLRMYSIEKSNNVYGTVLVEPESIKLEHFVCMTLIILPILGMIYHIFTL